MKLKLRFSADVLVALQANKILGLRAGSGEHRFIGLWYVLVENRVFVRSWSVTPDGWYETLLETPHGTMTVAHYELPIRSVHTRSERLKAAVGQAYQDKYHTPGALKYVRDLRRPKSKATTTELIPL
jgi:hypothetical protein